MGWEPRSWRCLAAISLPYRYERERDGAYHELEALFGAVHTRICPWRSTCSASREYEGHTARLGAILGRASRWLHVAKVIPQKRIETIPEYSHASARK